MKSLLSSLSFILASFFLLSCSGRLVEVKVGQKVINQDYLGNGAEWDPYCEAEAWGAPLTEEMWGKIFKRVDFMKMSIVRCMINSPYRYYDYKTGEYIEEKGAESLKRVLAYCQANNIKVMFGEFNPPKPSLKLSTDWVKMSVRYLDYLVNRCGFSCIKYYIPVNEPDGDWSYYDGDFDEYLKLVYMIRDEMSKYSGLTDKVKFAAPDAVLDYKNPRFNLTTADRVALAAERIDSLTGLYEIHAYPGFHQVRSGKFAQMLRDVMKEVPSGKRLVLGEAGFKTWRREDSLRDKIHKELLDKTPLIRSKDGADCSMSVYTHEYGLDMALLAFEVMNNGGAGVCPWMLDDSHSFGDKGDKYNIKIWGMWNIFGEKLYNMPEEENIRPWYYSWSLMCRYFPAGSDILESTSDTEGIHVVSAYFNGSLTVALLNLSGEDKKVSVALPYALNSAKMYSYERDDYKKYENRPPMPDKTGINISGKIKVNIKSDSMVLITEID